MSLSVLQAAAQTYGLIWRQRALLLRFALVPWILLSLASLIHRFLLEPRTELEWWLADLLYLLNGLLVLPLAIQCCRLTALGPDAVRREGFYRMGPEFGKVAALVVIWFLVSYLVHAVSEQAFKTITFRFVLPPGEPSNGEMGASILSAGYLLAYAVFLLATIRVVLRLLLVFPALSVGGTWDLRSNWQATRSRSWFLLGLLIATTLPVILLMTALDPEINEFEWAAVWPPTILGVLATLLLAALECFDEAAFAVATTVAFVSLRGPSPERRRARRPALTPRSPGAGPWCA